MNTIVNLSGMDTSGLTPENFHERTVAAGLNNGLGFRLRPTADLTARVNSGEISRSEARQIRLEQVLAQQNTIAAAANEGQ